jgi:hypothetical protein
MGRGAQAERLSRPTTSASDQKVRAADPEKERRMSMVVFMVTDTVL